MTKQQIHLERDFRDGYWMGVRKKVGDRKRVGERKRVGKEESGREKESGKGSEWEKKRLEKIKIVIGHSTAYL